MGRDKALLTVGGVGLATRAMAELAAVCAESVLVTGRDRDYSALGHRVVTDRYDDYGPLAGLEAALAWAAPRPVFVLACDLPHVDRQVVGRVLADATSPVTSGAWARIARREGRLQPLCGLYGSGCREVAAECLDGGRLSVLDFVARLEVATVEFDDLANDPFFNLNTPEDAVRAGGAVAAS